MLQIQLPHNIGNTSFQTPVHSRPRSDTLTDGGPTARSDPENTFYRGVRAAGSVDARTDGGPKLPNWIQTPMYPILRSGTRTDAGGRHSLVQFAARDDLVFGTGFRVDAGTRENEETGKARVEDAEIHAAVMPMQPTLYGPPPTSPSATRDSWADIIYSTTKRRGESDN
jgi:hypothetical protein